MPRHRRIPIGARVVGSRVYSAAGELMEWYDGEYRVVVDRTKIGSERYGPYTPGPKPRIRNLGGKGKGKYA